MRSGSLEEANFIISGHRPGRYDDPPFATFDGVMAELSHESLQDLDSETLCKDLRWLAEKQRALEAESARRLAQLDRREEEGAEERPNPTYSASQWLQSELHLTPHGAYAQIRTARQLDLLPHTAAALARGDINAQQVTVICRAMEQVPKTTMEPSDVEAMLVEAGRRMDPRELHRSWQQLRYQEDQEAGLSAEQAQHQRRWFTLRQRWNGSYRLAGDLDAEGGTVLKTAMESLMGPRLKGDDRTAEQRRADAVVELARRPLDAGELPSRGGQKPHLTLVSDLATLRLEPGSPLAELDWGPLVTGHSARRIACDAVITPVLTDEKGKVLHVGKASRALPTWMRKAVNLRDRHCQEPGCWVPAEQCQPHHRRHVADGGRTELSNLELLCARHHRDKHPENDRFRRAGGDSQDRAP